MNRKSKNNNGYNKEYTFTSHLESGLGVFMYQPKTKEVHMVAINSLGDIVNEYSQDDMKKIYATLRRIRQKYELCAELNNLLAF